MTPIRASGVPKFRHETDLLGTVPIPGRECGSCTLCCKWFAVPAIDKPRWQWCQHCAPGKGCNIYRDRPVVCRDWNCGWKNWQWIGEEWYPLESKIVINPNLSLDPDHSAIDVHVDPACRDQWRKPEYLSQLRLLARRGLEEQVKFRVIINIDGLRKWIVLPNEEVEFNLFQKLAKPVEHRATCWQC
jgi:hypothetical protein